MQKSESNQSADKPSLSLSLSLSVSRALVCGVFIQDENEMELIK